MEESQALVLKRHRDESSDTSEAERDEEISIKKQKSENVASFNDQQVFLLEYCVKT